MHVHVHVHGSGLPRGSGGMPTCSLSVLRSAAASACAALSHATSFASVLLSKRACAKREVAAQPTAVMLPSQIRPCDDDAAHCTLDLAPGCIPGLTSASASLVNSSSLIADDATPASASHSLLNATCRAERFYVRGSLATVKLTNAAGGHNARDSHQVQLFLGVCGSPAGRPPRTCSAASDSAMYARHSACSSSPWWALCASASRSASLKPTEYTYRQRYSRSAALGARPACTEGASGEVVCCCVPRRLVSC